jgi:hypothetical protein
MIDLTREELEAEIERAKSLLSGLEELRSTKFGADPLPPVESNAYADIATWVGIRDYLREHETGEYSAIYTALLKGGSPLRHTSNPPWAFRKSLNKSLKAGRFLLNGKNLKDQADIMAKPGDIISLPK